MTESRALQIDNNDRYALFRQVVADYFKHLEEKVFGFAKQANQFFDMTSGSRAFVEKLGTPV